MSTASVVEDSLDEQLDLLLRSDATVMGEAPSIWQRLRREAPVHRHGPLLMLARHEPIRPILRDRDRFVTGGLDSTQWRSTMAGLSPRDLELFRELIGFQELIMSRSPDVDRHDRLRRVAHRVFTPRQMTGARDAVERYTMILLDELEKEGVVDLGAFAFRLPLMVIGDMLGIPSEDHMRVHHWCAALATGTGGDLGDLAERVDSIHEFRDYLSEIVDLHRVNPDSVSPLVAAMLDAEEEERLTLDELVAMFANLSFAGHETTANLLSIGIVELLRHPDEWQRLVQSPSLAGSATQELLRFVTPVQFIPRTAARPVTVEGVDVEPGQTILLVLAAANRDEEVFSAPEELDITRENAGDHVAFGFGPRFCIGNSLAMMEGQVAFETLAQRFPSLRLADEPLEWHGVSMLRRLKRVPVHLHG